jgi:hypothetical protein
VDPTITAAIVTAAATLGAAVIALFAYRHHARTEQHVSSQISQEPADSAGQRDDAGPVPDVSVVFAGVGIARGDLYWYEYSEPSYSGWPFTRRTSKYFAQNKVTEGSDLPLDVTLLNKATEVVILTAVGIEIVSVAHVPYGRPGVAGPVPKATRIKRSGSYDLQLPGIFARFAMDFDPDEDVCIDVNEVCSTRLVDPIYLEAKAPFRYLLNLTAYDLAMPNHAIVRLWAETTAGDVTSDEITIHYHWAFHSLV